MASGKGGGKYPGPVTMNDMDPSPWFITLFLTVPELKTGRSMPLIGAKSALNAEIKPCYEPSSVLVEVAVKMDDGKIVSYEYKKDLPHDIDVKRCQYKVKNGMVKVILCKLNQDPWTAHSQHFVLP